MLLLVVCLQATYEGYVRFYIRCLSQESGETACKKAEDFPNVWPIFVTKQARLHSHRDGNCVNMAA